VYEELIQVQGAAARIVCARLTDRDLAMLKDSVQFAAGLTDRAGWNRRVAAHGQVLTLLAAAAGDSVVAAILGSGAEHLRDLAIGAGPESAGIMVNSHRRLLTHMRAGNADAAAAEIEGLFRALHVMHPHQPLRRACAGRLRGSHHSRHSERSPMAAMSPSQSRSAGRGHHCWQLGPGRNAEFRENPVEMRANGPV
jgi:FCD domain